MSQIKITIEGGEELKRAFTKLGAEMLIFNRAMKDTGEFLGEYFANEAFASQGGVFGKKWARLNPQYAVQKAKLYAGRPTLIASGKMQRSFRSRHNNTSVEVDNTTSYFKYHQSEQPRNKLPRRPMMGVNAPIRRKITEIFEKDMQDKIKKAGLS